MVVHTVAVVEEGRAVVEAGIADAVVDGTLLAEVNRLEEVLAASDHHTVAVVDMAFAEAEEDPLAYQPSQVVVGLAYALEGNDVVDQTLVAYEVGLADR